jgi:hypothetical protein
MEFVVLILAAIKDLKWFSFCGYLFVIYTSQMNINVYFFLPSFPNDILMQNLEFN